MTFYNKLTIENTWKQLEEYMAQLGHIYHLAEGSFKLNQYKERPFFITTSGEPELNTSSKPDPAMIYVSLSNPEDIGHMQVGKKEGLEILLDIDENNQKGNFTYQARSEDDWRNWQYLLSLEPEPFYKNNKRYHYKGSIIAEREEPPFRYRAGRFEIYFPK